MKRHFSFEQAVLAMAAVVLLFMGVRFVTEQRGQTGPWLVEVERHDSPDTSDSVDSSNRPDSLLENEVIHLNTASRYDLERLPGIGETRAKAILNYRQEHGPFQSVDDLLQVSGIGPGALEELRAYVTVE